MTKIKFDYSALRAEKQKRFNNLFDECHVFWAFSNEQFHENKTPLKEGETYLSIGAGGYMTKSLKPTLDAGVKAIEKWYKTEIKKGKQEETEILYELNNVECFMTGGIENAWDLLKESYTREQVQKVYNKYSGTIYAAS